MKNKKLSYILIPLVVLIWAIIIIKFVKYLKGPQIEPNKLTEATFNDTSIFLDDTFSLIANYRDPFLHKQNIKYNSKSTVKKNTKKIVKKNTPPKKNIKSPNIKYSGFVQQSSAEKGLGFININGKSYTVREGDVIDKIKIVRIYKDSIKLKYEEIIKTYYKN